MILSQQSEIADSQRARRGFASLSHLNYQFEGVGRIFLTVEAWSNLGANI
jgi:hypothetical protein